ncbi:MAG: ABC transporter permease [Lautropia sp.]|nr:ABC transporter permease [Lautropia sp.]
MNGFLTLFRKELLRFWKVAFQTVAAPVLSALLYLLIFSHALTGRVDVFPGVPYTHFLVPGLVMMALLQNAFANASSSLIQSKVSGNLVFVLLAPLTPLALYGGYVLSAMVRGVVVGLGVLLVTVFFHEVDIQKPLWALAFALAGSGIMGTLGLLAGIWAEKFDQIAAFQNFLVTPLTFLSGVFYSVHSLPPFWLAASHANPFFYMVDGFRYGFFGQADADPWVSLGIVSGSWLLLALVAMRLLRTGYHLRY